MKSLVCSLFSWQNYFKSELSSINRNLKPQSMMWRQRSNVKSHFRSSATKRISAEWLLFTTQHFLFSHSPILSFSLSHFLSIVYVRAFVFFLLIFSVRIGFHVACHLINDYSVVTLSIHASFRNEKGEKRNYEKSTAIEKKPS